MVSGHLSEKKGLYYAVINYIDKVGNRKTKWIATGLPVKGNKRRAEAILNEQKLKYAEIDTSPGEMLFADFLEEWLEVVKTSITTITYSSYSMMVKKIIAPYFRRHRIRLVDLTAKNIQDFYLSELKRVSANTVIHYHANIHKALKYAVKIDLIPTNPADKIERPKKAGFTGSFYDTEEMKLLLEAVKGTRLETPVMLAAFYGLRRSEVLGLKWDAVDFDKNTITIKHTVTSCDLDGKHILIREDRTKTKSSMRTLPLVDFVKEKLLLLKAEQEENRRLCGKSYIKDFMGYICINEIGDIIKPQYLTVEFPKFLEKKGLRRIRFHDLRHSCASLLLANGVSMKQIQEWLGHSDFSTTANIYAHLDYSSKLSSADALRQGLGL
jgi:integrase